MVDDSNTGRNFLARMVSYLGSLSAARGTEVKSRSFHSTARRSNCMALDRLRPHSLLAHTTQNALLKSSIGTGPNGAIHSRRKSAFMGGSLIPPCVRNNKLPLTQCTKCICDLGSCQARLFFDEGWPIHSGRNCFQHSPDMLFLGAHHTTIRSDGPC